MPLALLLALLLQPAPAADRPFRADQGYASTPSQRDALAGRSGALAAPGAPVAPLPPGPPLALVCPHDDHALAGPVYRPAMERVKARHLLLIGVAHKAWRWKVGNVLIFDTHSAWDGGAMGRIPVDTELRAALLEALAPEDVLVSDEHHAEEHSLEALVPWLGSVDGGVKIVPVLVPAMPWERMEALAARLADAMALIAARRHWEAGRDVQILISNDATHYGDQGWGGRNHAPYGIGCEGLARATANDRRLIDSYLAGPLRPERLRDLLYELVEEEDLQSYKVTWCGRFALPFGLEFTRRLAQTMKLPVPDGRLLAYSTSVELGQLEIEDLPPTAPANLRHWVAYAAMGWWVSEEAP